ncbi:SMP-30/gluconolactonase/LRE family protein [Streptomyces sp. NPDC048282]|uniref:SMP-30/gluconolactonase/LRE family protein n=1 Tax=Streptomyces sp. NPDC048282 TaxID=3365528 RepID=UPI00371D3297
MPRFLRRAVVAPAAVAIGLIAAAPAASSGPDVSNPHVIAHFDLAAGQTPENMVAERNGSVVVSFSAARQIAKVTRERRIRVLATLPAESRPRTPLVHDAVTLGLARAEDGTLYVNYATGTAKTGIWRIPASGGAPEQIAALPPDGVPNGLALDERRGVLYAADSVLGTVWRVPLAGGTPTAWAAGGALDGLPETADGVGANGIKVHKDAVWVTNSDRGMLLRIPVAADGSAGVAEERASGLPGVDDFVFPGHSDIVLAALITSNEVALVRPDGTHSTVLGVQDGLSNPTSLAVSGQDLFVASDAYFTQRDPNLLKARLRAHFARP